MNGQHEVLSRFTGWSGQAPTGTLVYWLGDKLPAHLFEKPWTPQSRAATDFPPFDEEYFEWVDLLEAASDAGDTFTFLELGAGYGRWSARAACAARQLGKRYRLGLAEAAPKHIRQLHEVMVTNGVGPCEYDVFEAAIAGVRGEANFVVEWPEGKAPPQWYGQAITLNDMTGAEIVGEHEGLPLWRMIDGWGVVKLPQIPLSAVLANYAFVDLADFDLQGAEADAIEESLGILSKKVRRLHIGTHGHDIEARLRELLSGAGWECLRDFACAQENDTPYGLISFVDGVQSWINRRLTR